MAITQQEIERIQNELLTKHGSEALMIGSTLNTVSRCLQGQHPVVIRVTISNLLILLKPEVERRGLTMGKVKLASQDMLKANETIAILQAMQDDEESDEG